jgi:uncharacterized protein YjiS (DUF1127 family)
MTTAHYRSVPRVAMRATLPAWRLSLLFAPLRSWLRRARQRRELAELNDTQLNDVGLSRHIVKREVEKPFWMT